MNGDIYYAIKDNGYVQKIDYLGTKSDIERIRIGNYFANIDEGIKRVEQLKIEEEIREFIRRYPNNDMDFTSNSPKVYLAWDAIKDMPIIKTTATTYTNVIYFNSQHRAQKCIEYLGIDKIRKYLDADNIPKKRGENNVSVQTNG